MFIFLYNCVLTVEYLRTLHVMQRLMTFRRGIFCFAIILISILFPSSSHSSLHFTPLIDAALA